MIRQVLRSFKIVKKPKEFAYLGFDQKGRSHVYHNLNGQSFLRLLTRTSVIFSALNAGLSSMQLGNPIFTTWNLFSFTTCSITGLFCLAVLQIFSRRVVNNVWIYKNSDTVEVQFYNALWKPKKFIVHVSHFQNPGFWRMGFFSSELTDFGRVLIDLNRNQFKGRTQLDEFLMQVLEGKSFKYRFQKKQ